MHPKPNTIDMEYRLEQLEKKVEELRELLLNHINAPRIRFTESTVDDECGHHLRRRANL